MEMKVLTDAEAVAEEAAKLIATEARAAVSASGRFVMALSGGATPWTMLRRLATENLPWEAVHIFQVDERVAPTGDPERNLTHLIASLKECRAPLAQLVHAMPVEAPNLDAAAGEYADVLRRFAGAPPTLDLVHLGLGADGHTASLVPNDPVLNVVDKEVAMTGEYLGHRRMTLTYPMLNRARRILWLVTGAEKADMLGRLLTGDPSIPAGRVRQDQASVLADLGAAGYHRPSGSSAP